MDLFSFFSRKPSSKDVAKDRLEMLKTDIIRVISNYMEIDEEELDIQITQTETDGTNGSVPMLYANIPIKSMRKVQM